MENQDIESAVRALLEAIGENPTRDGLLDTPARVSRALDDLTSGINEDPAEHLRTVFQVDSDAMVVVHDITFHSLCEHHMLPFFGKAHVGYLPAQGRVTGLSKLARCVDGYAKRLQVQERLTKQIADAVQEVLQPKGIAVLIEAEHTCMTMRGVQKAGALTTTTVFGGALEEPWARAEFLSLIGK